MYHRAYQRFIWALSSIAQQLSNLIYKHPTPSRTNTSDFAIAVILSQLEDHDELYSVPFFSEVETSKRVKQENEQDEQMNGTGENVGKIENEQKNNEEEDKTRWKSINPIIGVEILEVY